METANPGEKQDPSVSVFCGKVKSRNFFFHLYFLSDSCCSDFILYDQGVSIPVKRRWRRVCQLVFAENGKTPQRMPALYFPELLLPTWQWERKKNKKRNAGDKCTPQQQQSQLLRGAGIQPGTTHIWQNNTACLALHKRKIERTQFIFEKVTCLPEYPMSPDVMDSLYRIFFSGPAKLRLGLTTPTFVYLRV